ncbi:MAG: response regulator, partial [Flavobacteriales bacterium]|nr:response regulator [Flavobacteriales bacterium]
METSMLLVDDHPVVQMGMKSFIERNELFDRVIIAGTGAETISAIEKQKEVEETFSLAIMDINLPDYEIISLVKRVRKMIPDTPILM